MRNPCVRVYSMDYHHIPGPYNCRRLTALRPFPSVLYEVLERAEYDPSYRYVLSWEPDGLSFAIHDRDRFASQLMPLHFSFQRHFASFQRQLNLYGFRRISARGSNSLGYCHKDFVKGEKERCSAIQRTRRRAQKSAQKHAPSTIPRQNANDEDATSNVVATIPKPEPRLGFAAPSPTAVPSDIDPEITRRKDILLELLLQYGMGRTQQGALEASAPGTSVQPTSTPEFTFGSIAGLHALVANLENYNQALRSIGALPCHSVGQTECSMTMRGRANASDDNTNSSAANGMTMLPTAPSTSSRINPMASFTASQQEFIPQNWPSASRIMTTCLATEGTAGWQEGLQSLPDTQQYNPSLAVKEERLVGQAEEDRHLRDTTQPDWGHLHPSDDFKGFHVETSLNPTSVELEHTTRNKFHRIPVGTRKNDDMLSMDSEDRIDPLAAEVGLSNWNSIRTNTFIRELNSKPFQEFHDPNLAHDDFFDEKATLKRKQDSSKRFSRPSSPVNARHDLPENSIQDATIGRSQLLAPHVQSDLHQDKAKSVVREKSAKGSPGSSRSRRTPSMPSGGSLGTRSRRKVSTMKTEQRVEDTDEEGDGDMIEFLEDVDLEG